MADKTVAPERTVIQYNHDHASATSSGHRKERQQQQQHQPAELRQQRTANVKKEQCTLPHTQQSPLLSKDTPSRLR